MNTRLKLAHNHDLIKSVSHCQNERNLTISTEPVKWHMSTSTKILFTHLKKIPMPLRVSMKHQYRGCFISYALSLNGNSVSVIVKASPLLEHF